MSLEHVQLDFEKQIFIELVSEDGLVVLARYSIHGWTPAAVRGHKTYLSLAHTQGTRFGQDIPPVSTLVLRPSSPGAGDQHLSATRGLAALMDSKYASSW